MKKQSNLSRLLKIAGRHPYFIYGSWMLSAVSVVLVCISGLICSHMGAFRTAANLRIAAKEHIVQLPLGLAEHFGSDRLRKTVMVTLQTESQGDFYGH